MKFRKILVTSLFTILFLSLAGNMLFLDFGTKAVEAVLDYIPIKWALITLGDYDYYRVTAKNPTQKVENWIYSRGVPYDEFPDGNIEAPTDTPSAGQYPLQYANGSIRYQVIVLVQKGVTLPSITNKDYILWAVGNGTNAVVFGWAAKSIPELLGLTEADVIQRRDVNVKYLECTVLKTFNDGVVEYEKDAFVNMTDYYTCFPKYITARIKPFGLI